MKTPVIRPRLLNLVIFIFLCLASIRCNNDPGAKPAEKKDQPQLTLEEEKRLILMDNDYVYSLVAARQDALAIASELDAQDAKRGNLSHRKISGEIVYSIADTIRHPGVTRKDDPGIYVFNFANNRGFAIISGDERIPGRLGWSGMGTLDENPNPALDCSFPGWFHFFKSRDVTSKICVVTISTLVC